MLRVFPQLADKRIDHAWSEAVANHAEAHAAFRPASHPTSSSRMAIRDRASTSRRWAASSPPKRSPDRAERFDVMAELKTPKFPGGTLLRAPRPRGWNALLCVEGPATPWGSDARARIALFADDVIHRMGRLVAARAADDLRSRTPTAVQWAVAYLVKHHAARADPAVFARSRYCRAPSRRRKSARRAAPSGAGRPFPCPLPPSVTPCSIETSSSTTAVSPITMPVSSVVWWKSSFAAGWISTAKSSDIRLCR